MRKKTDKQWYAEIQDELLAGNTAFAVNVLLDYVVVQSKRIDALEKKAKR
jgi:hypothetical protein